MSFLYKSVYTKNKENWYSYLGDLPLFELREMLQQVELLEKNNAAKLAAIRKLIKEKK